MYNSKPWAPQNLPEPPIPLFHALEHVEHYYCWQLELHMKSHDNINPFKCDICDKDFLMKWRLQKHVMAHKGPRKHCHYFNNSKVCPYEQVGCQFQHKNSGKCRFNQ